MGSAIIFLTIIFLVFFIQVIRGLLNELFGKKCPKHGCTVYETDRYKDKTKEKEYYCPMCHQEASK